MCLKQYETSKPLGGLTLFFLRRDCLCHFTKSIINLLLRAKLVLEMKIICFCEVLWSDSFDYGNLSFHSSVVESTEIMEKKLITNFPRLQSLLGIICDFHSTFPQRTAARQLKSIWELHHDETCGGRTSAPYTETQLCSFYAVRYNKTSVSLITVRNVSILNSVLGRQS